MVKERLPDAMLRYMTAELAEALAGLSQPQIDAIHRIVESGYLAEEPLAPWRMVTGDKAICSQTTWFKRGIADAETGRWLPGHRPGWSHQKPFVDALQMAKRLARQMHTQAAMAAVNDGVRAAQLASPAVVRNMVKLATASVVDKEGKSIEVTGIEHKDQVAAAKVVLGYVKPDGATQSDDDAAGDWWTAAESA